MFGHQNTQKREENMIFDLQNALKDDTQKFQITFTLFSESIKIDFCKFCKYSNLVQRQLKDIKLDIFQDCERIQKKYNIKNENIKKFFELLQDEKGNISNDQYSDLYKLSNIFEVESLQILLKDYAQKNSQNLDFIINLILDQQNESNSKISIEMEDILKDNIVDCLSNDKFLKLPIPFIYRVIERSDHNQISSDLLYEIIKKSIEDRCILFQFIDLKSLSDDNFNDLYENVPKKYLGFLQSQIDYIKKMKDDSKILENEIQRLKEEIKNNQKNLAEMKEQNQQFLNENNHLKEEIRKKEKVISQFPNRYLIPTRQKWELINKNINNIKLEYNGKKYEISCSSTNKDHPDHRLDNLFNEVKETGNEKIHSINCWVTVKNDQNPFIQILFTQPVVANRLHITSRHVYIWESPSYIQIFGINNGIKKSLGYSTPDKQWTASMNQSFKFSNEEQFQIYRIEFKNENAEYVGFAELNLSYEID